MTSFLQLLLEHVLSNVGPQLLAVHNGLEEHHPGQVRALKLGRGPEDFGLLVVNKKRKRKRNFQCCVHKRSDKDIRTPLKEKKKLFGSRK